MSTQSNTIHGINVVAATVNDLDRAAFDAAKSFVNDRYFIVERSGPIVIFNDKLTATYNAYWEA